MNRNAFGDWIESKVLVFDGAMGSMLMEKGMKAWENPETLNLTKGKWVEDNHLAYLNAGADVITTNTFGANAYKLRDSGYSVKEVIEAAVLHAKNAARKHSETKAKRAYIALDLGPIGALLEPSGSMTFEDMYGLYQEQVLVGVEAGVDFVLIETQTDLLEAKCAVLAAVENSNLPVFCTMSFEHNGRTFTGTDVVSMVTTLEGLGVSALGLNCSFGVQEMKPLVEIFLKETALPILVQPNAGLPFIDQGFTRYPFHAEAFKGHMQAFVENGVQMIGGCCGTTPEAIKILDDLSHSTKPKKRVHQNKTRIASYAQTLTIGEKSLIIGERINPTGKSKLKEALKNKDYSYVTKEACLQVAQGAHILDVNVGLPEIDEASAMVEAIKQIQAVVEVPLQLDSANPHCLEKAARQYRGKPLINSVNGKEESLESVLPIVKRYGACVLGLTLDEKGIPETLAERIAIAEKILARALAYGIPKENVLIDCLTLTASAQQEGVFDTLKALKIVKEKLGLCTALGVSNVSFGLPKRVQVHQTFYTLALDYGLDLAIINPAQGEMMWAYRAYNVLKGIDAHSKDYIEQYQQDPLIAPSQNAIKSQELTLKEAVFMGLKKETSQYIRHALENTEPLVLIESELMPILNEVGLKFEKGELYLPQLIQSAEAVGAAFEDIKAAFLKSGKVYETQGRVILATVQHDVHDIGKNIVKVVLENYGFDVVDLGKDVPPQRIIEAVHQTGIKLIGLSALMTTTVASMAETVKALKETFPDCQVVVGGAVLNADYAKQMQADFYAKDPNEFVHFAQRLK